MMSKNWLWVLCFPLLLQADEVILNCNFKHGGHGWSIPSYYQGKMEISKTDGRQDGAMKLVSTVDKGGRSWARTYRGVAAPPAGKVLRMSGYVKGKGLFIPGFAMSFQSPGGKSVFNYNGESPITLTKEWRYFEHYLDPADEIPQDIQARLDLDGAGEVWVDDLVICFAAPGSFKITIQPTKIKIKASEKLPEIIFSTGTPGEEMIISLFDAEKRLLLREKVVTNRQGRSGFIPADPLPTGCNQIRAFAKGISASAEIEVISQ